MSHHICENKKCVNHLPIQTKDCGRPWFEIINDNGERVQIYRFLYRSARTGAEDFFLCETCHNAVEMTLK